MATNNSLKQSRCLYLLLILLLIHPNQSLWAKEETAHITLNKTAVSNQKARPYLVKKGDRILDIMRDHLGITSHRLTIIKTFNPGLKNLDEIYPGQIIMLPEKEPAQDSAIEETASTTAYTTRRGDSITRIAIRQLNIKPSDLVKTVDSIRRLNPNIKDLNRIYPGQVLQLPRGVIVVTKQEIKTPQAESSVSKKNEQKENPAVLSVSHLNIIKYVIGRMNGSFIENGKYFIPIPQIGQVTIDCSVIPTVELDDGSTILVDLKDRLPESISKMIQSTWKNYRIVKTGIDDHIVTILQKIINASNAYTMIKEAKPYNIGKNPTTQFSLDWMISKKASSEGKPYLQGLIFVSDNSQLLPRPMIAYAERNGLIISEILAGQGQAKAPDLKYTVPEIPSVTAHTGGDLCYALLVLLGYSPVKDTEVRVFDPVKNGFSLSIIAPLLVKKGDRYVMIHSKTLPRQFIDNLKNNGTDTIYLDASASRKSVVEMTFQAMNISYSLDTFIFSAPEKSNNPRGAINIPAFKIIRNGSYLYLIDFDIDRDIYGLLHSKGEVNIIKF